MADEKENSTEFPNADEWTDARRRINDWLTHGKRLVKINAPAPGELGADFDEVAGKAEDRWLRDRKNAPETYAARALGDWRKKQLRSRNAAPLAEKALQRKAGADPIIERYTQEREDALREAVRCHCLGEFRDAWGVEWKDKILPTFLHRELDEADDPHVSAEAEARNILAQIERFQDMHSEKGGSASAIIHRINTRKETEKPLLWYNPSPLRRFVGRVMMHQYIWIGWGCLRAPEQIVPGTARSNKVNAEGKHAVCPNDRELAIIWLLEGGWPKIAKGWRDGLTVRDVIEKVRKAIAAAQGEIPGIWK